MGRVYRYQSNLQSLTEHTFERYNRDPKYATSFRLCTTHRRSWVDPPPGYETYDSDGNVQPVNLKRALYGTRQASRLWNETVTKCRVSVGFIHRLANRGGGVDIDMAWLHFDVFRPSMHVPPHPTYYKSCTNYQISIPQATSNTFRITCPDQPKATHHSIGPRKHTSVDFSTGQDQNEQHLARIRS